MHVDCGQEKGNECHFLACSLHQVRGERAEEDGCSNSRTMDRGGRSPAEQRLPLLLVSLDSIHGSPNTQTSLSVCLRPDRASAATAP